MAYIGNTTKSSPFITDSYTGTGSQTAFQNMTYAPASYSSIAVHVDGVYKTPGTDYTTSGKTLNFATAPSNGAKIIVLHLAVGQTTTTVVADGAITAAKIANNTITVEKLSLSSNVIGLTLPGGNTATRPATAANGTIRYNSSNNSVELFSNTSWAQIGTNSPTIQSVTGDFYGFNGSGAVNTTINITGTDLGTGQGVLTFIQGVTSATVSVTPNTSSNITNVLVPSTITNLANGSTVTISFQSASGATSAGYNKVLDNPPSGGTIVASGGYRYHKFTTSSALWIPSGWTKSLQYMLIAGGGAGGADNSGGGGAGGLVYNSSFTATAATSYPISIGGGAPANPSLNTNSSNGTNSTGFGATAIGGGRGATGDSEVLGYPGASGGSGGGAAGESSSTQPGGSGTPGQGNNGGSSIANSGAEGGGGGGGAGAAGSNSSGTYGGAGGVGSSTYSAWGLATSSGQNSGGTYYFAGGGGGGNENGVSSPMAPGGLGGGGRAGFGASPGSITDGTTNTGGGGGGGTYSGSGSEIYGGAGGSGICIVRYTWQ